MPGVVVSSALRGSSIADDLKPLQLFIALPGKVALLAGLAVVKV